MSNFGDVDLPPQQLGALRRARRIQYVWMVILAITVALMALVMGNSQAMKTAWIEDMLSFLPPIFFLLGARVARRKPTQRFPFGYHRFVGVGHLVSGVALGAIGIMLVFDGGMGLITQEKPAIGVVSLFGHPVWLGWLMITVALASCITPVIMGRVKMQLAEQLHDKILRADADMNKADWLTGLATAVGVFGIGLGFWWADAVAALVISVSITKDGWDNTSNAIRDLMDTRATTFDNSEVDPVIAKVNSLVRADPRVTGVQTRARDEGHVLHLEVFVQVDRLVVEVAWLEELERRCAEVDWRVGDVVVTVTTRPHPVADARLE